MKLGVGRVLGLPAKLISVPEAYIRSYHVLTVTMTIVSITSGFRVTSLTLFDLERVLEKLSPIIKATPLLQSS